MAVIKITTNELLLNSVVNSLEGLVDARNTESEGLSDTSHFTILDPPPPTKKNEASGSIIVIR